MHQYFVTITISVLSCNQSNMFHNKNTSVFKTYKQYLQSVS